MNIAYYCQHVLGVGHFHRSLEICGALARQHQVTMITGGRDLDITSQSVRFLSLPGLMMDNTFNNLTPADSERDLEEVKNERKTILFNFFKNNSPEIFIIELYPFGRKAFRFELDPLLHDIRHGQLVPCRIYCSLRDILVERSDREKFEQRIITTLNSSFHGLLIHGDQRLTPLEQTFSRVADIAVPIIYTGYVTPKPAPGMRERLRRQLNLSSDCRLIVASIGGGNVGAELLIQLTKMFSQLHDDTLFLQIFTGPYADADLFDELGVYRSPRLNVDRFTSHFPDWLAAADLSVSMAGYNTCMNILAAGVPALVYPFNQNREQYTRAKLLAGMAPFTILQEEDLQPQALRELVYHQLKMARFNSPVNLDGAINTVNQIEEWQRLEMA